MIPTPTVDLVGRQLWPPWPDSTASVTPQCSAFTLPSNGVLSLGDSVVTLTTNVVFNPVCTGDAASAIFDQAYQDPYYASAIPMTFVLSAATVIAWILVIMLLISSGPVLTGGLGLTPALTGGHGIIGGASGGSASLTGSGSRPWLQKAAALTVAISLTIATADHFSVARKQYQIGVMDAKDLRRLVIGSKEIRITRVISDIFLWLAQVQTLIRLFPRHKEKVLIKWIGFALILFDSLFSCLNSFMHPDTNSHGQRFRDAIPALSYLFQLALGLLYAAWVIYFSLTKYRYAFWHPKMRCICLIAMLSLIAILTPVVFFVIDVSNADLAGWGDYVRWVGAAAASVVVWEWVDRIELLERDEKKDGILGREIFDGDEMLDLTPSEEAGWTHGRSRNNHRDDDHRGGAQANALESGFNNVAQRFRSRPHPPAPQHFPLGKAHSSSEPTMNDQVPACAIDARNQPPAPSQLPDPGILGGPSPPAQISTPVSRSDTASAASTVYVIHYDNLADVPQPIRRRPDHNTPMARTQVQDRSGRVGLEKNLADVAEENEDESALHQHREHGLWHAVPNPFKRKRASPPQEVQKARAAAVDVQSVATPIHNFSRWDVRNRLGVLAAEASDKFRERGTVRRDDSDQPVTVIPAPKRGSGHHWSPVAAVDEETVVRTTAGRRTQESLSTTASSGVRLSQPPRADDISPNHRARSSTPTVVPAPRKNQQPLRPNDISTAAGNGGKTIVIAAPSRRSPPKSSTPDTGQSSARPGDVGRVDINA